MALRDRDERAGSTVAPLLVKLVHCRRMEREAGSKRIAEVVVLLLSRPSQDLPPSDLAPEWSRCSYSSAVAPPPPPPVLPCSCFTTWHCQWLDAMPLAGWAQTGRQLAAPIVERPTPPQCCVQDPAAGGDGWRAWIGVPTEGGGGWRRSACEGGVAGDDLRDRDGEEGGGRKGGRRKRKKKSRQEGGKEGEEAEEEESVLLACCCCSCWPAPLLAGLGWAGRNVCKLRAPSVASA